eukprot:TRINITY_DN2257_c0_g2_i4.p1 TRINITY_DN2257_c0_g2~~TRINITY_DN2257_c0_g2_i4.p1  ORF type:complete len:463 (+),score=140.59 TRINITY_DN2257_c0_g2_i4:193-1581(+)
MLSKEGLVHSSVSGDLERHKESYDEEVYGDAFNEIEQEFNCCGSEEDKVEFIEKKLKGNHRYEPILISLICALTNGLDQYIKNAEEKRRPIHEAVVQAVVLRMRADDCNDSFWKKTYDEKGNLLALHKACEDGNIDEIERLIKESPFMYRTMIACNPDVTSRKAEDTALHKVIKNKDVSTEEKIKICKIFMEDLGTWNLSDFKNTWGEGVLFSAIESESVDVPLLKFITKGDDNYDFIHCLQRLGDMSVSADNFDVFDFMLSSIGGDFTYYIMKRIENDEEAFVDCDFNILYRFIVVYMFARQRDMARLLYVLTNPKYVKTPLHFTEDIVEESLLKWISIQEHTKAKSGRTMRDDITFPESDDHYNPEYDFTDPENPLLKRARCRMLLEASDTWYKPQQCYHCRADTVVRGTNILAKAAHGVCEFKDYPSLKQIEEAGKDNEYWQQPYGGYDLPEIDEYFKL